MAYLKQFGWIIFGAFIIAFVGLFNGYPLVYSDTGTYIYSGFDRFIPADRPIVYGLFLKFFSFNFSAWPVIIAQNIITALVVWETIKLLELKWPSHIKTFVFSTIVLTAFTGIGWYTNQLMPDFFAPIVIMCLSIFLISKHISPRKTIVISIILVLGLIAHFTHLLISMAVLTVFTLVVFFNKKYLINLSKKRLKIVWCVVLSAWIVLPLINFWAERKLIVSKASHVFLVAHLADTGILQKFLNENCSNPAWADCTLCKNKENIPNNLAQFIWETNLIEQAGGWEGSKEEYQKIINATLKNPNYLALNIYKSITYGLIQLTQNDIGQGLTAYGEESPPYGQIHWRFNHEINNYLNSRQNKWGGVGLNFKEINIRHDLLLLLSVVILMWAFFKPNLFFVSQQAKTLLFVFLLGLVLNAFLTAGLNAPCERFQARVVWLLPFFIFINLFNNNTLINAINGLFKPKVNA